jgi:hypothetical protein
MLPIHDTIGQIVTIIGSAQRNNADERASLSTARTASGSHTTPPRPVPRTAAATWAATAADPAWRLLRTHDEGVARRADSAYTCDCPTADDSSRGGEWTRQCMQLALV